MTEAATGQLATKARRGPLEGQALLEFVARRIIAGDKAPEIARRCGIPFAQASKVYAEVFREVYQLIEDDLGPEKLKANKFALIQSLNGVMADCRRAVAMSFKAGEPNTRPYTHFNGAAKILASLEGHNAPTQTVNTDVRLYAAVRPEDMERVLSNPKAVRAMLEFEEAVSEMAPATPPPAIDVTPDAEGDDA